MANRLVAQGDDMAVDMIGTQAIETDALFGRDAEIRIRVNDQAGYGGLRDDADRRGKS